MPARNLNQLAAGRNIVLIVRDQHHRDIARAGGVKNPCPKRRAQRFIEAAERFVQQQRLRLCEQGPQQADTGTLPAGEGGRIAGVMTAQPGGIQRLLDRFPTRSPDDPLRQGQQQILPDAELFKQQRILKENAQPAGFNREAIAATRVEPQFAPRLEIV